MHQCDAMRTTGTSSSSQPQGQLGLADFSEAQSSQVHWEHHP